MEPQVGSTIGDYQVIAILGAGGMGKVYKVRNTISDRVEAMKVLLPDLESAPELADRFLREIKVQASLEHPNIASLHTAVRIDNQLLMLMEFVDGVTLEQKLREGPIPAAHAVDYVRQVLAALEFAHAHNVIHRDIKPANMMLTPEGVVKLMDFGIAKAADDHKLTGTGMTMGSLYYMSPEQIQGATNLDARADLYSLGISLYELVTGRRPFEGDSQFAIMSAHLQQLPVPPIQLDPKVPQLLNDVILTAVMKDPGQRFQSAGAFRNALGSVASQLSGTITAPAPAPAPIPMPTVRPGAAPVVAAPAAAQPKSRRGLWIAVGALTTAAAIVALVELAPWKGTKAASMAQTSQPAATAPASTPPPQQPAQAAAQPATPPADNPAPPVVEPVKVPDKAPATPARQAVASAPKERMPKPQTQPQYQPQTQPAAQVSAPTPQPQQQVAAPPPQPVQAAPHPDPNRVQLMELREKLVLMDSRAQSIRGTLGGLERAQQAKGYGLGSQYTGPSGLMENYLRGASDALNAGDVEAARRFLEKAEPPISALEKLLNK